MADPEKPMLTKSELAALDLMIAEAEETGEPILASGIIGRLTRLVIREAAKEAAKQAVRRIIGPPQIEAPDESARTMGARVKASLASDDLTIEDLIKIRKIAAGEEE